MNEEKELMIQCPICKKKQLLTFPYSVINQRKQLTTISVARGLVCTHCFQLFLDRNFKIRGYQKVDFELKSSFLKEQLERMTPQNDGENPENRGKRRKKSPFLEKKKENEDLFKNLLIDGNYVEYFPPNIKKKSISKKNHDLKSSLPQESKLIMTDGEIYEEFWEIIDDENGRFQKYIEKDERRKIMNNLG